jgi:uncharacterized protein
LDIVAMVTKQRRKNGKPDPAIVADIVQRIVAAADPEQIVLFGSAARGTMGPNSDYDLLVIMREKFNQRQLLDRIWDHLSGKGAPVDVLVASAEDIERYRDSPCLVYYPAMREGKVVYDCATPAAKRSQRVVEPRARQPRPIAGADAGDIPRRPVLRSATGRRKGDQSLIRSSRRGISLDPRSRGTAAKPRK